MKKIKTSQNLFDFKGEIIKEKENAIEIGMVLSNILALSHSNPALSWVLGKKLATEKEVELKAEEVVFVKQAINEAGTGEKAWLSAIVTGQLLEIMDSSDK